MSSKTGKRYPRNVYPYLDYDYADGLPADAKAWLDRFNEEFYGATFKGDGTDLHLDVTQRRDLNLVKRYRVEDIYHRASRVGEPRDDASSGPEASPTAADPASGAAGKAYRDAKAAFRALLPMDQRKNVTVNAEFLAVRAKLELAAGVITSQGGPIGPAGDDVGTRIEKLKATREVVNNLGIVVTNTQFAGKDALAAVGMIRWLQAFLGRIDEKLLKLGVSPPAPAPTASPAEAKGE